MHYFLAIFSKVHGFVENIDFSGSSARLVIFALGITLLSGFQENAQVFKEQKFSDRDQHVLSFSHGAQLFSNLRQSGRVCTKQRTQPEISTFCHFFTGHTTF